MKVEQRQLSKDGKWEIVGPTNPEKAKSQLVFVFGTTDLLMKDTKYNEVKALYPQAQIVNISDSGSIQDTTIVDDTHTLSAFYFERIKVECFSEEFVSGADGEPIGDKLGKKIQTTGLKHVLLFAEGLTLNGLLLIKGIKKHLPKGVTLSGGLAGDGTRMQQTFVSLNNDTTGNHAVAICLYGESLQIGIGTMGGWKPFGIERTITKAKGKVIYEIDNTPVLDLYNTFFEGQTHKDLGEALFLFPISMKAPGTKEAVIRAAMEADEKSKSIVYSGEVKEGSTVWLMKASTEQLVQGAGEATNGSLAMIKDPEAAFLVTCAGRRAVLKQRSEEEIEEVRRVLGDGPIITGFYSYGQIAPKGDIHTCSLFCENMMVTLLKEI